MCHNFCTFKNFPRGCRNRDQSKIRALVVWSIFDNLNLTLKFTSQGHHEILMTTSIVFDCHSISPLQLGTSRKYKRKRLFLVLIVWIKIDRRLKGQVKINLFKQSVNKFLVLLWSKDKSHWWIKFRFSKKVTQPPKSTSWLKYWINVKQTGRFCQSFVTVLENTFLSCWKFPS